MRDRLRELFEQVEIDSEEENINYVLVSLPEEVFSLDCIALESYWKPSGLNGWMFRVDPEDPKIPQQRHVHIAREKHISNKNKQVSWNADGSRHDRGSFNEKVASIKAVKNIARKALKLDLSVALESFEGGGGGFDEESIEIVNGEAFIRVLIVK